MRQKCSAMEHANLNDLSSPTVFLISTITFGSYCVSLYKYLYLLYFNTRIVRSVLLSPFYK